MVKQIIFIFSFFINFSFIFAQSDTNLEHLWYYKEEAKSRRSLFINIDKIAKVNTVIAPQTFYLRKSGSIVGTVQVDILKLAKDNKVKVMPLLANISYSKNGNEYFDQAMVRDLLYDKNNWERVAKFMREQGIKNSFIGWQLDLENINIKDKDRFLEFVIYLENELDKDSLILSAAIVSKVSDNPKDYGVNYWQNWAGVYDYRTLGKTLDHVSVMAYDQPLSPGPIATREWSQRVLDYTLRYIPKEKVSFGIPTYAWAYRSDDLKNKKRHFKMVNFELVKIWKDQEERQKYIKPSSEAISKYWVTGSGDDTVYGGQSWISYNLNSKNYTIWYENKNSFEEKLNTVKKSGVRGYSAWVLGDEDPKVWDLINIK